MGRRALTLFELLLVLVLLVLLGALSMPALDGAFSRSRLRHAGDQVRAAWTKARLTSLQSGQTHAFRCLWGDRHFATQPYTAVAAGEIPKIEDDSEQHSDDPPRSQQLHDQQLTEGVYFAGGQVLATDTPPGEMPELSEPHAGEWSEPILFFADGTTSDVSLILANQQGDLLRVTLRGLTGVSLIGDVDPSEVSP